MLSLLHFLSLIILDSHCILALLHNDDGSFMLCSFFLLSSPGSVTSIILYSVHCFFFLLRYVLCCASSLSHVWLFVTPWTIACRAPLPMGNLQARILEWIVMPFSRRSSQPRDQTQVSHRQQLQADSLSSEPPRVLEWVAYPFSRGSSQPRNLTEFSCIAGRYFTCRATRETHSNIFHI